MQIPKKSKPKKIRPRKTVYRKPTTIRGVISNAVRKAEKMRFRGKDSKKIFIMQACSNAVIDSLSRLSSSEKLLAKRIANKGNVLIPTEASFFKLSDILGKENIPIYISLMDQAEYYMQFVK